jgi:hypothetical protein
MLPKRMEGVEMDSQISKNKGGMRGMMRKRERVDSPYLFASLKNPTQRSVPRPQRK